jgi:uncharacterized protein YjdB
MCIIRYRRILKTNLMKVLRLYVFRTIILLSASLLFLQVGLYAQTPISPTVWSGSPASAAGPSGFTTLPATTTPGAATVGISQWDRGAVVVNAAGGCYNSNNWQVGGTFAAAQAANKCIFFTVTNSATTELQITRLFIRSQVSATGPTNVQVTYTIGSVTGMFGPTVATAHSASPEDWNLNDNICLGPGQVATFRLYGWGATGAAGTLRINDNTAITAGFATPISATASSNSPICAGTDLYLTGAATGGIPGYTYSWAGPDGFAAAVLSPTLTAVPVTASGVYTLTVTDALNCTTSAVPVTTTVTVNTSPAPITGTLMVCPLLTTTLNSTSAGGSWSSSNTSVATITASGGIVTGVAPGTATITYQLSSSCITTAVVTVSAPPSPIVGSLAVCAGFSTTLSSAPAGGTWVSGDATVATVTSTGTVLGGAIGNASITYTATGGCIAVAMVTVYPLPMASTGTPTVCVGATTTLSNASTGGSWSTSNAVVATVGLASGLITGQSAGTANITYTLAGGCYVVTNVTVQPLPGIITGTLEVCQGLATGLSNSAGGGSWASSTPAIGTAGSGTGVVTGISPGTTTITYTLPTGCYSTTTVTVNPLPAAITGSAGVCLGATTTLNSTTAGGQWFSDNAVVAPIGLTTGVVSGSSLGTARISYVLSATGCMMTRMQTVHPLPTAIAGPNEVCPGFSITLSSSPSVGTWTSSDILRATAAPGGIVTGVAAGTAIITYTLPTSCIATRQITVNPAPPASITPLGDTTFCPGGFVLLMANTGASLSYQWFLGTSPVVGATTNIYTATATGSYRMRITNDLGCPTMSVPMSVLVDEPTAGISVPAGVTTACATAPILLNASPSMPGHYYTWLFNGLPIPGAASGSYSAGITGNYSVIVFNSTGCFDTSVTVAITMLPAPGDAVAVSGSTSFCTGGNVVLTAETGTGYTYQWHNAAGLLPGATGMSYTENVAGSYFASVMNGYGCAINTVTVNVVVNPLPIPSILPLGATTVCAGTNVTLNAISGGPYAYQWYKDGVAIPGATSSVHIATASGGYRVRVINTSTGCSAITIADTVVTIVSTPAIMALTPTKFCWGGSSLLTTSVSGAGMALNYQWFLNSVAIPGATSPTYSADATGNYKCAVSVPSSCTSTTLDKSVSEMPLPSPMIAYSGSMLSTASYYVTYQWYKNLIPIPGATSYNTLHTGAGNYKVRVVDTNGCQSTSDVYAVKGPTGLDEVGATEIRVYPNPVSKTIFIDSYVPVTAVLISVDGREVMRVAKADNMNIQELADGIYVLMLYTADGAFIKAEKLLKQ